MNVYLVHTQGEFKADESMFCTVDRQLAMERFVEEVNKYYHGGMTAADFEEAQELAKNDGMYVDFHELELEPGAFSVQITNAHVTFTPPVEKSWPKAEDWNDIARLSSEVYSEGYYVVLSGHGDPDHGQAPYMPVCQGKVIPIDSLFEASNECQEFIKVNNLGSRQWVGGQVYQNGEQVANVSYNGRVWDNDGNEILDDETSFCPR